VGHARLEDLARRATGFGRNGPPHGFDLAALGLGGHPATPGQEHRMHAATQRPAISRSPRHESEPRAVTVRDRERDVRGERMLGQALAHQHDGLAADLSERRRHAGLERVLGRVAVVDLLEHVGLVLGQAQVVLGEVPEPGPARPDHEHPGAGACRLADPKVQNRHLPASRPASRITFAR
jgi:hypothetical protein